MKLLALATALAFAAGSLAALPFVRDFSDESLNATQLRLAYNGASGMTVAWNTPQRQLLPAVFYGEHPDLLLGVAVGTSTTFNSSTSWDNVVYVERLRPGTK